MSGEYIFLNTAASQVIEAYADGSHTHPSERTGTRIRTFLAQVSLLAGCVASEDFWAGRRAIERLAIACEAGIPSYRWTLHQCAAVASFLSQVCAEAGECPMCEEGVSRVSAASGRIIVMTFLSEQISMEAAS